MLRLLRCLTGCPWDAIFASRQALEGGTAGGRITTIRPRLVTALEEDGDRVQVRTVLEHGEPGPTYTARRVLLAAGPVMSTALALTALGRRDEWVGINDCQAITVPALAVRRTRGIAQESRHTLAQLFMEAIAPEVGRSLAHVQIYGHGPELDAAVRDVLRHMRPPSIGQSVHERALAAHAFLSAEDSGRLEIRVSSSPSGRLVVESRSHENPRPRESLVASRDTSRPRLPRWASQCWHLWRTSRRSVVATTLLPRSRWRRIRMKGQRLARATGRPSEHPPGRRELPAVDAPAVADAHGDGERDKDCDGDRVSRRESQHSYVAFAPSNQVGVAASARSTRTKNVLRPVRTGRRASRYDRGA